MLGTVLLRSHRINVVVAVGVLLFVLAADHGRAKAEPLSGLRVPQGFEVTLYADDDLAHDIYALTFDSHGRVVVAGRGYVKILHDNDHDGTADSSTLFSELPASGAHGLLFLGNDLVCTGDDAVMRLSDTNGDGVADSAPQIWARLGDSEHGANGLQHGPDGWVYLICGNDAGVSGQHVQTAGSPVHDPQSGAVVRFDPKTALSEVVAHGFRNPYDLSFNRYGQIFTVDSDGERDHHLPWYSPTRLFDVAQGRHHGWVLKGWQRSWNRPEWFYDNVERLAEIGRGSPTGVEVYRHTQFPPHYREGVYSCCWTLGRVYYFPLRRSGSSYATDSEVFLETTGDTGFAPVDLAVGPAGDLFVAIGGRQTRGGVFRIRYREPHTQKLDPEDPVAAVLRAPQPLAAWSRAQWMPLAEALGARVFERACVSDELSADERIRAVEVLTELFGGLSAATAEALIRSEQPELVARAAWALGRQPRNGYGVHLLAKLTAHRDLRVERAAWESLVTLPAEVLNAAYPDWSDLSRQGNRRVRWASLLTALRRRDANPAAVFTDPLTSLWASLLRNGPQPDAFAIALADFASQSEPGEQLEAIRLMQLALGDVVAASDDPTTFPGYSAQGPQALVEAAGQDHGWLLAVSFPTEEPAVDVELARLLSMLRVGDADLVARISNQLNPASPLLDDLHYLFVLANLTGPRHEPTTWQIAESLLLLPGKLAAENRKPSRNWPIRLKEVFLRLLEHDDQLAETLIAHSAFGLSEHSLYVLALPADEQRQAARRLLELMSTRKDDEQWTPQMVEVIALLPADEALPYLRSLWDDPLLRDTVTTQLASVPRVEDRERLLAGLNSVQPGVLEQAARALSRLPAADTGSDFLPLLRALRQACGDPDWSSVRAALHQLLLDWTRHSFPADYASSDAADTLYQAWLGWFQETYPEEAGSLSAFAAPDRQAWQDRLQSIDWTTGDVQHGKTIFARLACHLCHEGQSRLGPDLRGTATRFSRQDLFAAIVSPSEHVAPPYQTTQIVTASGKIYHGLIVYQSPDGTLIQTSPDQVVRIAEDEIVTLRKSQHSLMPTGLLNDIDDREIADLYAYLRTLE